MLKQSLHYDWIMLIYKENQYEAHGEKALRSLRTHVKRECTEYETSYKPAEKSLKEAKDTRIKPISKLKLNRKGA